MTMCGATKKDGSPCHMSAMPNGRCRLHGGKTPVGFAHPSTQHGRYSKYLPTRLSARYQEALRDPALLELMQDIALLDMRLGDVLQRMETGDTTMRWQSLQDVRLEAIAASKRDDKARASRAINTILEMIGAWHDESGAWDEIGGLLEQRRKLVESERKRLVEMQQTMTVEKAMLLAGAILGIIKAHVHDRDTLHAISTDIQRLIT